MNLRQLQNCIVGHKINDMAHYTFIARGSQGKRGHRVSVDARTRKEAEDMASKKVPGETLELVSRTASAPGALSPANKSSNPKKEQSAPKKEAKSEVKPISRYICYFLELDSNGKTIDDFKEWIDARSLEEAKHFFEDKYWRELQDGRLEIEMIDKG